MHLQPADLKNLREGECIHIDERATRKDARHTTYYVDGGTLYCTVTTQEYVECWTDAPRKNGKRAGLVALKRQTLATNVKNAHFCTVLNRWI